MQTIMRSFRLAILAAMAAAVLIAEDNAISRQQGDDMLSELRQIRQLLRESLTSAWSERSGRTSDECHIET